MTMLIITDGFLIFLMLLFSSKLMIYSTSDLNGLMNIMAVCVGLILLARKRFVLRRLDTYEALGVVFFAFSFLLFNFSKFFGELTTANAIIPTGMVLIFMLLIPFCYSKSTLKNALLLYSKFNFYLLVLGLPVFFFSILGTIHSIQLVHAADHANPAGYVSLYGLAYYPSWFKINLLGISYYRFSGVFWEPGTLGLYMVFLITIEFTIFYKQDKNSKYRVAVFFLAGIASLSLLFFAAISLLLLLLVFANITNKKHLAFIMVMSFVGLTVFYIYYDYIYALILYRFDIDSQRGFAGNTRSGVFQSFLLQFEAGNLFQQLFGFGPYAEFEGDSTSFVIKIFQRGIIGFVLLVMSFLFMCIGKHKKYVIPVWGVSLAILCQFEGAIFLLILSCLLINDKENKNILA